MGDYLKNLPVDSSISTVNEQAVINTLFTTQKKNITKLFGGLKDVILVGVLFAVFSLPFVNNCVNNIFKFTTNSTFYTIVLKTILFMLIFFILQNYFLAKKEI
jgi:hypothetical protein